MGLLLAPFLRADQQCFLPQCVLSAGWSHRHWRDGSDDLVNISNSDGNSWQTNGFLTPPAALVMIHFDSISPWRNSGLSIAEVNKRLRSPQRQVRRGVLVSWRRSGLPSSCLSPVPTSGLDWAGLADGG